MKRCCLVIFLLIFTVINVVQAQEFPKVILKGDYPDPTILRDGKDYYMTHSSFTYTPGFLIWHSTDLHNWEPVTRALGQLTGSVMAPDLVKFKGTYYIYFPGENARIYVIHAKNIAGPWSSPKMLNIPAGYIDPGHIVGEDGKRYLFLNNGKVVQLSEDGLTAVTEPKLVYDGWSYPSDWNVECKCLESPKLFKRGDYFYLVSAEGGTAGPATSHMVIAARSKSIFGPWENSPYNPVVHTYSDADNWWSKGHGTLVDDVEGKWWVVYHAYLKNYHTLGRQTLIEPIEWTKDGWFKTRSAQRFPGGQNLQKHAEERLSDDFTRNKLGWQWTAWNGINEQTVKFNDGLLLKARGHSPVGGQLLLVTVPDTSYTASVEVTVPPGLKGGLLLFYDEEAFAGVVSGMDSLDLYTNADSKYTLGLNLGSHFYVRILNLQNRVEIDVSKDKLHWDMLAAGKDLSTMNHNVYKHFLALRIGLVSIGASGYVKFNNFSYKPVIEANLNKGTE